MRALASLSILVPLLACQRSQPAAQDAGACACEADAGLASRRVHPLPEVLARCPEGEGDELARAVRFFDLGRFHDALSCAVQASASDPGNPDAQSEKAAALAALGRLEEARLALAAALAADPDHVDALVGAADLYATRLPPSRDHSELGLAYANRGLAAARRGKDEKLEAEFLVVGAMALNDLGRPGEALARAKEAEAKGADDAEARYEVGSALFELCRFPEAEAVLATLQESGAKGPWAQWLLGLIAEREGRSAEAVTRFARARAGAPDDFPADVPVSPAEFEALKDQLLSGLPSDMRRDLSGVVVSTQDLPDTEDLTADDPPLSPSILGLFRGPSLDQPCPAVQTWKGPCRAVVLYRKNLARATRDRAELEQQTRVTLVHEVGHLRGEDDTELQARGLE